MVVGLGKGVVGLGLEMVVGGGYEGVCIFVGCEGVFFRCGGILGVGLGVGSAAGRFALCGAFLSAVGGGDVGDGLRDGFFFGDGGGVGGCGLLGDEIAENGGSLAAGVAGFVGVDDGMASGDICDCGAVRAEAALAGVASLVGICDMAEAVN